MFYEIDNAAFVLESFAALFAGAFIFVFHGGPVDPTYAIYVATGLLVWFFIIAVFVVPMIWPFAPAAV